MRIIQIIIEIKTKLEIKLLKSNKKKKRKMAQKAVIERKQDNSNGLYRDYYMLHGECLKIASHCYSLGFSYDYEINMRKVEDLEEISDTIMILIDDLKRKLKKSRGEKL